MAEWQSIERPGYFGAKRDAKLAEYDRVHGKDQWRLVWLVGELALDWDGMTMLYEDAYFEFLKANPEIVDQLVSEASDVFDDAPSNIYSGLDYSAQETDRTHVQDISIRRALVRLGRWFEGDDLIQIRDNLGTHKLSMTLSPGQIPFHRSDLILGPEIEGWWKPGSVESFYQSNKVLQALKPNG